MAATKNRRRQHGYRGYAAYGNLAYELDTAERDERRAKTREMPRIRSIEREEIRPRARERVSPFAIAGFAVTAALLVMVLMSYIQLNAISDTTVALRKQLSELQTQNVTLTADYQKAFDLDAVEAAAQDAGMTKASAGQIYYVDMSGDDSAVVYQPKDATVLSSVFASMGRGIYALVEYFR
jgi:cell division protein FtsB